MGLRSALVVECWTRGVCKEAVIGIAGIPSDWIDVKPVQDRDEAIRPIDFDAPADGRNVFSWETHLGTCPDCQHEENL